VFARPAASGCRIAASGTLDRPPALSRVALNRRHPLDDLVAALALDQRHLQPLA
jgi:hypothetical protein